MRILLAILARRLADEARFVGEVFARLGDGEDEEDDHEGQDDKHRDKRISMGRTSALQQVEGMLRGAA